MSGNSINSMRRNTELRTRDKTDFSSELSVSAQFGPAEEDRKLSMQDSAVQRHPQRYPMAVCDPEERWVREYIEQTGEEPGFF